MGPIDPTCMHAGSAKPQPLIAWRLLRLALALLCGGCAPPHEARKLLIVDGSVVITGGINVDSVYSSGSLASSRRTPGTGDTPWRDTDVRIEGPAAAQFQKFFLETWAKQHGPALEDGSYFPRLREPGSAVVRAIGTSPDSAQSASQAALLSAIEHAERSVHITNAYFVPR